MKARSGPQNVASYYDQNTLRFLRLGGSGDAAAIHRQVWAPGVQTRQQAFLYLNQLVLTAIQTTDLPLDEAIDLGCGVGGTATWLADHRGLCVTGVTNSPVQRQLAEERSRRLGLESRCRFILADYLDLPALGPFQAAYAIESFVHSSDPARFFQQAARQLVSGSRLVICDDFLAEGTAARTPRAQRRRDHYLRQFQSGWHIGSLLTTEEAQQLAQDAHLDLVDCLDLTAYLRQLNPAVLYPLAWLGSLPFRWAYWHNLSGGLALQVCIRNGWIRYQSLVFVKRDTDYKSKKELRRNDVYSCGEARFRCPTLSDRRRLGVRKPAPLPSLPARASAA